MHLSNVIKSQLPDPTRLSYAIRKQANTGMEQLGKHILRSNKSISVESPLPNRGHTGSYQDPLDALKHLLFRQRLTAQMDAKLDGKPSSVADINALRADNARDNTKLTNFFNPLYKNKPTDMGSAELNLTHEIEPTGAAYGTAAGAGVLAGGAIGTGVSALTGGSKLTGGLVGAGLGGLALPLALLAAKKSGKVFPKDSTTTKIL